MQFLRCFIRYTIYDDCNIFAGNRMESNPLVQYRLLGRDGFSAVRKTNTKKEKTSCRSNDKHKIQRRYEGSNICSICHDYGNFCQVKVTLLHKIFVAKYIFIFNRVLCCKNWKNETLIGITKMDFSKALFFVIFWANLVSFVSVTISKMHYVCKISIHNL